MTDLTSLIPRQPVPQLTVPTVAGGTFTLAEAAGDPFTIVVFYRGLHCPICKMYLGELERQLDAFKELGIEVVAISSDTPERAAQAKSEWHLDTLAVGHSLPLPKAREWGLFVSAGHGEKEPAHFSEPGLFLVRPDGTLYASAVQTMPFARPHFGDLVKGLKFIIENDYPGRGEVVSLPPDTVPAQ